jgi:hypothetical protein
MRDIGATVVYDLGVSILSERCQLIHPPAPELLTPEHSPYTSWEVTQLMRPSPAFSGQEHIPFCETELGMKKWL